MFLKFVGLRKVIVIRLWDCLTFILRNFLYTCSEFYEHTTEVDVQHTQELIAPLPFPPHSHKVTLTLWSSSIVVYYLELILVSSFSRMYG